MLGAERLGLGGQLPIEDLFISFAHAIHKKLGFQIWLVFLFCPLCLVQHV
ncbi:hypothetical protein RchiOBHm_Chr4g0407451 [Rosa chinensis]|uniref:Uncharacterized protein n=1 Tax=Rosa chinensis TaxID=74649 RepID=A0A2P6QUL4_ROSCH|nr:hypothetical protein RchiOBHm_Chr4g0407451 [Rosa chinensis]